MSDLVHTDRYRPEARNIVSYAEKIVQDLKQNGAYEGHNLMAAQCLAALRNLSQMIEDHHQRSALEALPIAVDPPVTFKRRWWSVLRACPTSEEHVIEASN